MPDLTAIGGWAVAVIVGAIAALASLFPKKGSLEHQMIDQQQEDIKSLRDVQAAQGDRIERLEANLTWYQRRDLAWERREAQIMSGVERGVYPPWPDRTGILAEEKHD